MSFSDVLNSLLSVGNSSLLLLAAWSLLRARRLGEYPLLFCFFLFSALFLSFNYIPGLLSRAQFIKLYWANELIEQGFALSMMVIIMRLALARRQPDLHRRENIPWRPAPERYEPLAAQ